ncbi:MAG: diguanylate cyclase [Gammaproteobacteria bacterium]|nr:diguanylate cyclase [Gammaproteobacteria bacterium]
MSEQNSGKYVRLPPPDEYVALVLLVDDQMIVCEAVRKALAGQPQLDFHFCTNSEQALATAKQLKPTVILQDLIMPGIDGLTLVREYRADPQTRNIPVIVLSASEDPVTKSEAFRQGANDYVVKLPDPMELLARIRYHSRAYLNQIQRDDAYRALRESQQQLMEMNIELQRLNNIDGLTGLSNRRYCDQFLDKEWKRAIREKSTMSVLMIDVDNFKRYNDTLGHLAGDEALQQVATTIRNSFARPADLAARFGGEEFIVILPSTPLAGAQYIAEKIRHAVEQLQMPCDGAATAFVTVSIGVAAATPQREQESVMLIEVADIALYQAKKAGKNQVIGLGPTDTSDAGSAAE